MNLPNLCLRTLLAFAVVATVVTAASAQTEDPNRTQPNFQVALHLIVGGSNAAAKGSLPSSLAGVSRLISSAVPYPSYRLASTFIGRVGNGGTFEYKSVGDILGPSQGSQATFMEWSVGNLRMVGNDYQAQVFRFGARVPVETAHVADAATGKTDQIINYERIGLTFERVGISENVPTLLGTLSLPKTGETLFLVMTVSRTDR